jgi:hypothetical protein
MTKLALLSATLLAGASLAGCAQEERAPPMSGTSSTVRPMAAPVAPPASPAPGAVQPMSSTYGSGTSVAPVDLPTQQTIRNRMAQEGYTEVSNLQREPGGGGYTATAVKDGKVVDVMIDASGKVTRIR